MEALLNTLVVFLWIPVVLVVLIIGFIIFKLRYKIAKPNHALVISGGKKRNGPTVLVSGGAFVSPFRRHDFFSLAVMTVESDDKETQTKTVVPVVVRWTAQLKPDIEVEGSLAKAVMGFIGKKDEEIKNSLQQTLEGEVRAVVANLTPEEVIQGRDKFKGDIEANVKERMAELGFKLISLNITEVKDGKGHYDNLAARDREEKRREAENLTAREEQSIAETAAATSQASEAARLNKELAVAEKQRDLQLKQAGYQAETDKATQDAIYAGRIREQEQERELATREGAVAVERENQQKAAAEARRAVVTTEAETAKQRQVIEAQAAAEQAGIDAEARVVVAERDADAEARSAERKAGGQATAAQRLAEGKAEARKTEAAAEADFIRKTREANAAGIEAEGRAEAAAIREKGLAEAEAEKAKAEALAEQEGVNLQVTLAEIESKTRIQVSNNIATAVAEVGTNATIIDMGGGGHGDGDDLLTGFLKKLPSALAQMDVSSGVLTGQSGLTSINQLASAVLNKPAQPQAESSKLAAMAAGVGAVKSSLGDQRSTPEAIEEVAIEVGETPTAQASQVEANTLTEDVVQTVSAADRQAAIYAASAERKQAEAAAKEKPTDDEPKPPMHPDDSTLETVMPEEIKNAIGSSARLSEKEMSDMAQVYAALKETGIDDKIALTDIVVNVANQIHAHHMTSTPVDIVDMAQSVVRGYNKSYGGPLDDADLDAIVVRIGQIAKQKVSRSRSKKTSS